MVVTGFQIERKDKTVSQKYVLNGMQTFALKLLLDNMKINVP